MATARSVELRALAQRVADALPADVVQEVVLTGSVSRGVADELSDVELLVVAEELPDRDGCVAHLRASGVEDLDLWSRPESPARQVSGLFEGVSFELIWWSRAFTDERVAALAAGEIVDGRLHAAEAIAHGVPLRTAGGLARWQDQLSGYPASLTGRLAEQAADLWGGYQPAALLTATRADSRLALVERLVEDARRIVRIVFAVNETWEPTPKRLAERVEPLPVKPARLAERIDAALLEPDPRRALLGLYELAAETVALAPPGPYVLRARAWLPRVAALLR